MTHFYRFLTFLAVTFLLTACVSTDTGKVSMDNVKVATENAECLITPNADEPALVRITKGPDGMPQVTPELVVVLPEQEVIFMSRSEFKLHFIGLSPVNFSPRGKKDFESENGEVIIPGSPFPKEPTSAKTVGSTAFINDILKEDGTEKFAKTASDLRPKLPVVREDYIILHYNVEIDGVILDPRFKKVDH